MWKCQKKYLKCTCWNLVRPTVFSRWTVLWQIYPIFSQLHEEFQQLFGQYIPLPPIHPLSVFLYCLLKVIWGNIWSNWFWLFRHSLPVMPFIGNLGKFMIKLVLIVKLMCRVKSQRGYQIIIFGLKTIPWEWPSKVQ